jgi:aryl carrier-like protein
MRYFVQFMALTHVTGPVSPISAGKVNDVIRVLNLTGTTEGLFIGNLVVPREDWYWFAFHPYSGFEFKETEPGTYEHWVHRNEHWELFQGIFHTFPEQQSINFKDLYMRHPTKPNLWSFKGRSDDLVVLSNGYKILPLKTEAIINTHSAISGCLVIGNSKPQAALLIELKDPSTKSDKLSDSIWAKVQEANLLSGHNQLKRDFIAFAEADKPFVRTDKGTIKRHATLKLYDEYIERFYSSRDDDPVAFDIDTSSSGSTQGSIREVLASLHQAIRDASVDDDLFSHGLDSLGVFAAIKIIRAATGLQDQISPRHLYANPTIAKLSAFVARLVSETKSNSDTTTRSPVDNELAKMKRMITQHQARQSFKLNAFDYVNPNHYMGLMFYFPLGDQVSFDDAFANLQDGLNRTFDMIPALGGKMMPASEYEIGYKKGDLCVTVPPALIATSVHNRLMYKDLSQVLPPFEELRDGGFVPSAFKDELVLPEDTFPKLPADIVVAQANFVKGGCILAVNLNHCCLDGVGFVIAIKAWAENCRFLQGDKSATCNWYDPESFNHSLPEILHEQEGYIKPVQDIDPGTWGFLPFTPPDSVLEKMCRHPKEGGLPTPLEYPLHPVWPLPHAERRLNTTLFLISPENVQKLKHEVIADPEAKGVITSISDIVQAFFWRSAIRARYRVAKELQGKKFTPDEQSILELPTDGRPYFSPLLPDTYMGSMLILNRSSMPVETLCSPETSIGQVAYLLRGSAGRITPSLVHDAFTLLQSLPDHSRFSTANMGLSHMNAMISNILLFQTSEINFGDAFFANGGSPETMRPQLDRGAGRFRFLVVFPMKKDGGVELALGTFPEELDMLKSDEEFNKYATLVDSC